MQRVSVPLQSYNGDGFTINPPNVEYFMDYFAQKFVVDTSLYGKVDEVKVGEVDEVTVDTIKNGTHDMRRLNTVVCYYSSSCRFCSVSDCASSCHCCRD